MTTDAPVDFGYALGVAWERPDIAARVSLTYSSAMEHTLLESESLNPPPPVPAGTLVTVPASSTIETPQSVNLDFQTGIAPDTLLFGSVR